MKIGKFKIMKVERYLGYPAGRVRQWRVTCPACPRHMRFYYRADFEGARLVYLYHRHMHAPQTLSEVIRYRWSSLAMESDENEVEQFRNEREGRWSI